MEEFLAQHPEHADDDENDLMVARIDHERAEREALEQQRQELLKRKLKLMADNKKRRDDLAGLDKDLEKFIDVSFFAWERLCIFTAFSDLALGRQTYPETIRESRVKDTRGWQAILVPRHTIHSVVRRQNTGARRYVAWTESVHFHTFKVSNLCGSRYGVHGVR